MKDLKKDMNNLFLIVLLVSGTRLAAEAATGVEPLARPDLLAELRNSVSIGAISSYDRSGGNDDGFSGKYSFIRKEANGLVIADLKGPGVIYRIWSPTVTDDMTEFYFDGEAAPRIRIPFSAIFSGKSEHFPAPLSGSGAGGSYSYVPLPYRKSCKVMVLAQKLRFIQINYATYPVEAGITTYPASAEYRRQVEEARNLFAASGEDISARLAPPGAKPLKVSKTVRLAAGKPAVVFETRHPGRILGLRLGPPAAFASKRRGVRLRIYWDGSNEAAVDCPAGDLFGYAWGQPAIRSLLAGTAGDWNYLYLPMPFDRSARVELVQEDPVAVPTEVKAEIIYADVPRRASEGRLFALWRRENPTESGRPFTFLEASERGHVVGAILQAQGKESGETLFFEGDDETTIDGELVIHGTGSEDFFNGGWYDVSGRWDGPLSLPLSGALGYQKHLARTGGYRFFLGDAYPFRRSISQVIEHAPTGNNLPADYAGTIFFYAQGEPRVTRQRLTPSDRQVHDPDRIVFQPGWSVPVKSFSLRNASLEKRTEKFGTRLVRSLRMRTEGEDMVGLHHLALSCDLPEGGVYRVLIEAIHGPTAPTVQLYEHEKPIGSAIALHAAERKLAAEAALGEFTFVPGSNELFFRLKPNDGVSSRLDFELVRVVFEKTGRP